MDFGTLSIPGPPSTWVTFNPELETDDTYQRFVVHPPPGAVVVKTSYEDNDYLSDELRLEIEHVLEYAMEQKEKDIRGALAAAKEVLDRAKPEDGEEGTEVRNTVNFRFFDPPEK